MQTFYLLINWLATLTLLGLGLTALLRNRRSRLNIVFAIFTFTSGVWIMASYISNDVYNSAQVSVIGNYFVFAFSYATSYLLLWFAAVLCDDAVALKRLKQLLIPTVIIGLASGSPLVVASVHQQDGVYAINFGPLVILYAIGLFYALIYSIVVLRRGLKRTQGNQKAHIAVLYKSMIFALPLLLLTEFILPAATGWFGLTNIGLLFWLIPVAAIYYSVAKYKLFDLRLIIFRSLGYIMALGLISMSYALITHYVSTYFSDLTNIQNLGTYINVALFMFAIIIYQPAKRNFDRLSARIFYQDAYDPQVFLDDLNNVLVTNIDLEKVLNQTINIVEANLKSASTVFSIRETSYFPRRIIGDTNKMFTDSDIKELDSITPHIHEKVIITDFLEDDNEKFRKILQQNNIGALIRLVATLDYEVEGVGYLILGTKKSGNPYNKQDIQIMEIIANELVIAIQNALRYEEIEQFNVTLQDKIDDATRRLKRTNDKLKQMDETKDEFISMASHQLRTPLTSVKGYLSMVLEGDAGEVNQMQHKLLDQAFISSQRMVYLIADLLNVSRLRTGKFVIEPVACNLADAVDGEYHQLIETAQARGLTLTYKKPENFPVLPIDETKIRQVMMNFMDNAIYYSSDGGHIDVEIKDKGDTVEYTVTDDGIGVPKSEQHHLFTKFYRAGNAKKARPDGTGLGLFMAKKVVVAQGDNIIFKSEPGKGSVFGFSFQKSKLQSLADSINAANENAQAPAAAPAEEAKPVEKPA